MAIPRVFGGNDDEHATNATRGNPRAAVSQALAQRAADVVAPAPAPSDTPSTVPTSTELVTSDPPAPASPTPASAVEAFLAAERSGHLARSYGFLSAANRADAHSPARWRTAHDQMPRVRGFSIGAVRVEGDRAEVDVDLAYRPELDAVVGLVPAHATTTWIAVAEDGGWRVDYAATRIEPRYADQALASGAARRWAERHRGCHQMASTLLGSPVLIADVCETRGAVVTGAPQPLTPGDASDPFLAAYGPDVFDWARVVPLNTPIKADVVLAPFARSWRVIGVVDLPYYANQPTGG